MKGTGRRAWGNTLTLVIATLGILAVLIAFFLLNYGQLIGLHKEGQTAIDAAALQAAKDAGRIVVEGPLGRIALLDEAPGTVVSPYPVKGINSVLGTIRLDALIATKLGNKTILYLVQQDLNLANQAASQLATKITASALGQSGAYDKDGKPVNIKNNAYTAYKNNTHRMGNTSSQASSDADFSITLGTLKAASPTNIPVPSPSEGADINDSNSKVVSGKRVYLANVDIAIPGLTNEKIRLGAINNEPRLISNSEFQPVSGSGIASVLQVSAVETSEHIAQSAAERKAKKESSKPQQVRVMASAQVGGRIYFPPSGGLLIAFNGGIPADPADKQGPDGLSFKSPKGILNASQLNPAQGQSSSPYLNWNGASQGTWYVAEGGPVPDSSGAGSLKATPYRGLPGRGSDDPSVALSFLVYDWLRTLGLRPDWNSVTQALAMDFKSGGDTVKISSLNNGWVPAAYAADSEPGASLGAIVTLGEASNDPRNLANLDKEDQYHQQSNMWGYVHGEGIIHAESPVVAIQSNGDVTTVDGNPLSVIDDIKRDITMTNMFATQTYNNALSVLEELATGKAAKDPEMQRLEQQVNNGGASEDTIKAYRARKAKITAEVLRENPHLAAAMFNATYCTRVTVSMKKNLKTLTGGGAKKLSPNHYVLMGSDFYPAHHAATVDQLRTPQTVTTGQNSMAPVRDWCATPQPSGDSYQSALVFFKRSSDPVIGKINQTSPALFMTPVFAQQAGDLVPPSNKSKYLYRVVGKGDANSPVGNPGEGVVERLTLAVSPATDTPVLKGQAAYQNVHALTTVIPSSPNQKVYWQVQARSQAANAFPEQSSNAQTNYQSAAQFYGSSDAKTFLSSLMGQQSNSGIGVVCECAFTCPVLPPGTPEIPNPEIPDIPETPNPVKPTYTCPQLAANVQKWADNMVGKSKTTETKKKNLDKYNALSKEGQDLYNGTLTGTFQNYMNTFAATLNPQVSVGAINTSTYGPTVSLPLSPSNLSNGSSISTGGASDPVSAIRAVTTWNSAGKATVNLTKLKSSYPTAYANFNQQYNDTRNRLHDEVDDTITDIVIYEIISVEETLKSNNGIPWAEYMAQVQETKTTLVNGQQTASSTALKTNKTGAYARDWTYSEAMSKGNTGTWGVFDKLGGAHKWGVGAYYGSDPTGLDTSMNGRFYTSAVYQAYNACSPTPFKFST